MQVNAVLTMTPELKSELRNMVHAEVADMIQGQPATAKVPEYLNLGDSAAFLNISRGTLTKLIKSGDLKLVMIGRAKRLAKSQLVRYMANKAV